MPGKRILVVNEKASVRELLSSVLIQAGYEVQPVADGDSALAAAFAGAVDGVVLDVLLPGLDGFEICRRLQADARTAHIPVVFLTASMSGEYRRRAFSLGASEFLAKPFQMGELPAHLDSVLRLRLRPVLPAGWRGSVTSVIGADRAASIDAAIRLAETKALRGDSPVMLVDLEQPTGSIGARLQLAGGPNARVLLQDTGEGLTLASVGRVAQRYHARLEVIPAPFSPPASEHGAPAASRLEELLDLLEAHGYDVVLHLGGAVNDLIRAALARSASVQMAGYGTAGWPSELRAALSDLALGGATLIPAEEGPTHGKSAAPQRALPALPAPDPVRSLLLPA